jgi:hypothetical protein
VSEPSVEELRKRHSPMHVQSDPPADVNQVTMCSRDEETWPCDTVRVLYEFDRLAERIEHAVSLLCFEKPRP